MSMDPETISLASRALMVAGFGAAMVAAAVRRHCVFAAFLLAAALEAYGGLRYPFHIWVRDRLLGSTSPPGDKQLLQSVLLSGLVGAAILALVPLVFYFGRATAGRRLLAAGLYLFAAMLCLELISPHYVDAVIYHPQGPFALSAIAYFVSAVAITVGLLKTRERR